MAKVFRDGVSVDLLKMEDLNPVDLLDTGSDPPAMPCLLQRVLHCIDLAQQSFHQRVVTLQFIHRLY
jgi:hypothetical protein